jgi:hypothetical protein
VISSWQKRSVFSSQLTLLSIRLLFLLSVLSFRDFPEWQKHSKWPVFRFAVIWSSSSVRFQIPSGFSIAQYNVMTDLINRSRDDRLA